MTGDARGRDRSQRHDRHDEPGRERVVAPLLEGLTGIATRFTPAGYGEKVAQKLVHAGDPLVRLDPRDFDVRVALQQARVAQARHRAARRAHARERT